LGLIPASLIPISHAPDDLVSQVEGQTSYGTQGSPPTPLVRDHEGSDTVLLPLPDDPEDNHWRTRRRKKNAKINETTELTPPAILRWSQERWSAQLSIDNLLDESYQDYHRFYGPGRAYYFNLAASCS